MRIALYMTTVLEYGGGLEKYLIDTAAHLSNSEQVEQIDIITMDDTFTNRITDALGAYYLKKRDRKLNFKDNINSINKRLGKARYYKCSTISEARAKLQEYDVIYSKNELIDTFILKFLIKYTQLPPVILGGHTPLHYVYTDGFYSKLHNVLYNSPLYKLLAKPATRYHALNNHEKSRYAHLFGGDKVYKIPNPFDGDQFKAMQHLYPYKIENIHRSKINILWVGRLSGQKGVVDLRDIINEVNANHFDSVSWNIAGDGEQRYVVDMIAEQHKNVNILGFVNPNEMSSLYSIHDAFLSTSKWEGYPYNLLEARTHGLDIFSYDIPGSSDILSDYTHGHIVQTIDEMSMRICRYINTPSRQKTDQPLPHSPEYIYSQLIKLLTI